MANQLAANLNRALRTAGIPIVGVSISNVSDRLTWTVQFLPEATAAQRTQAAQIVSTFDPADPTVVADQKDAEAKGSIDGMRAIKAAMITALWGRLNRQPTAAEIAAERTRFVNIYKALD